MGRLADWLNEPDHFDASTAFLHDRGLIRPTRWLMALVAGSSALTPLPVLATDGLTPASLAAGAVGASLAAVMTWFWLTRWPTRRQSLVSCVLGTFCIAAWSLSQSSPAVAALVCTATAVTGGYLAFFHNPKAMVLNIVVGLTISVVATVRLVSDTDVGTAVGGLWVMWLVNFSVPLAIHGTSRAMSRYAAHSDTDPLTGLLNRRGFGDAVGRRLLAVAGDGGTELAMVMVDLDDFKRINDTYGHAAGDRALQRVAELMGDLAPADALVCRAGGEEFLVALAATRLEAARLADRLCEAVTAGREPHHDGLSASVGVVLARRDDFGDVPHDELIDRMINAADHAMYEAKRNGGDRVVVAKQYVFADEKSLEG